MKNKKIIITGASGFIGTSLFRYLKKKGYDVYGVDFNIINKIDEKIFDINLIDYKKKEEFFKRIKPEFIFHLAAFAGPPRNEEKPELAYKYNVELIEVILKNLDNSIPIFFPSTDKIFVGHKFPNEKADLNPDSVHGKVKLECEKLLKRHVKKYFILRQPVVHSAGGYIPNSKMSGSGSFIDQAIDNIRLNKTVKIFSNVKRCFVKLEELILVYEILLENQNYGTYNLASPMISYYDRLVQICKKNQIKYEKLLVPIIGNVIPLEQNIDCSKFEKTFNIKMS